MYLLHAWSIRMIRGDCWPHILKYSVFWPCAFVTNYYIVSIRFKYPIPHMLSMFELPNVPGKRHDFSYQKVALAGRRGS